MSTTYHAYRRLDVASAGFEEEAAASKDEGNVAARSGDFIWGGGKFYQATLVPHQEMSRLGARCGF